MLERPKNMQDKRSVVPMKLEDVNTWLFGPVEQAQALVRRAPPESFNARPKQRAQSVRRNDAQPEGERR